MLLVVAFFAEADEIALRVEELRCRVGMPDVVNLSRLCEASVASALSAHIHITPQNFFSGSFPACGFVLVRYVHCNGRHSVPCYLQSAGRIDGKGCQWPCATDIVHRVCIS